MTEPTPDPAPTRRPWLSDRRLGLAGLVIGVAALGLATAPWLGGAGFVRSYLVAHPDVLDEAVAARQARESDQQAKTITAAVAANPALMRPDPRDPAFGPADAEVTVVEFFDFRCPGCKAVAPQYLQLVRANPDVRFVFKDWPILDRGDDVASQYAARAALAAHRQGKYLEAYSALMSEPALEPERIDQLLTEIGVDLTAARAAIASPEMSRHQADIHTTASALRLTGTPTFIVNGRATATIAPADVARAIAAAKAS